MADITARFTQSPSENLRYLLDFTLDLNSGESVSSVATPTVTPVTLSPLIISSVVLAPAVGGVVNQVTYFASGGLAGTQYEVDFLTTTSLSQVIETVVSYNITSKT